VGVLPEERRIAILEQVGRERVVRADQLARRFSVSVETIRRDLLALERRGLTRRVYGGVTRAVPVEAPFEQRRVAHIEEKRAMGAAAAALIEPDDMCILDIGTSVAQIAAHLPRTYHGRVLTNSILVAAELAERPDVEVLISGGRVRGGDLACHGQQATAFFEGFYGGKAFLGSGGVHAAAGLTDFYLDEAATRQLLIERADEVYVMADASKLGRIAPVRVCGLERVTAVVTDDGIDEATRLAFEEAGVRLIIAPRSPPVGHGDGGGAKA
jgi:DeoR/GlpR family transcriptional regulator of sugar metabolism